MQHTKETMRSKLPKIYSQDLINSLFKHPYTKVAFLINDLLVHRSTAVRYLDTLVEAQILDKQKLGKDNYDFNTALYRLLHGVGERLMQGKPL